MKKLFIVLALSLSLVAVAGVRGAETSTSGLTPGDEAAIKAHPKTFKDLGEFRVIQVRGYLARLWYEHKYDHHNMIVDLQRKIIIILVLEDDI